MLPNQRPVIQIIHPSSRDKTARLPERLAFLEQHGFTVRFSPLTFDPSWPIAAASQRDRSRSLNSALLDDDIDIIWCARGGYGASDLLPAIPWEDLKGLKSKLVVGFSDISALHSALLARLGWRGLHAPMPASELWGAYNDLGDVTQAMALCKGEIKGGSLALSASLHAPAEVSGWLFGGCFSVLTNLIGTPYFPPSLLGALLFWEDIAEPPGRITRYFNQWEQSGALEGIKGIVLGRFLPSTGEEPSFTPVIAAEIARRIRVPIYTTDTFGHCAPNLPLMIGASATITGSHLSWSNKETVA